jgi:hypothetical protein
MVKAQDLVAGSQTLRNTHIKRFETSIILSSLILLFRSPGGTPVKTRAEIEAKSSANSTLLTRSLRNRLQEMRSGIVGTDDEQSDSGSDFDAEHGRAKGKEKPEARSKLAHAEIDEGDDAEEEPPPADQFTKDEKADYYGSKECPE